MLAEHGPHGVGDGLGRAPSEDVALVVEADDDLGDGHRPTLAVQGQADGVAEVVADERRGIEHAATVRSGTDIRVGVAGTGG